MGLQDLERLLSSFWEGIFIKSSRQVQPVEIARALIREMAQQRRVSVSRIYAPNIFTISLGADDFEKTAPLQAALSQELEEHIRYKAAEKGFTLIGRPSVSFEEDRSLGIGEIRVRSSYASTDNATGTPRSEKNVPEPDRGDVQSFEHTMIFRKEEKELPEQRKIILTVVHGPDQGKKFPLEGEGPFMIGRKSTNHIVLSDINASREHALLEYRNGELYLIDLNSRNGTFVNGNGIDQKSVEIGDQIQIGENLLQIEGG